jgi:hypothetical protein
VSDKWSPSQPSSGESALGSAGSPPVEPLGLSSRRIGSAQVTGDPKIAELLPAWRLTRSLSAGAKRYSLLLSIMF